MEPKAAELVAILKNTNLAIDAKVTFLNGVKSDIKQKNVPEDAVPSIFDALQLSIGSQHSALLSAGFSTLGHFLKRLFIQGQHDLVALQGRHLYPLLLERLGDHKERIRAQAAQAFTDLWPAAGRDVEQYVLELALAGKNNRAKEMSMLWLANMTKNHGLLFRSYVPSLVACLEDADSTVRDTAKSTVVDLFQDAPAHAKSDLRKQMSEHKVRKSIVSTILANIGLDSDEPELVSRPASRVSQRPASRASQRPVSRASRSESVETVVRRLPRPMSPQKPTVTASAAPATITQRLPRPMSPQKATDTASAAPAIIAQRLPRPASPQKPTASAAPSKPTSGPISQDDEKVEPLNVSSSREIDDILRTMTPYFEGRESEDNWMHREKSVLTLRRLLHGNAPEAYPQQLIAAIKSILDGIFKAVNSLRTTLGANGCLLVQDVARQCGPRMDPMMEIIMQNLMKLCASMKKITAQNGNITVDIVIANVSYTHRILQHITTASLDKNVQLRLYSAGWMKTLIVKQANNKASIEHGGGLELIEKGLRKGLSDANPDVRQAMRRTFWTFYSAWRIRAQTIMSDLDYKSRSLLEKDPANPNVEHANTDASKSSTTPAKPPRSVAALKEAIAAHKRKYLAPKQALPPRPESSSSQVSSLSSAPMRPAAKKPQPAPIGIENKQAHSVTVYEENDANISSNNDIERSDSPEQGANDENRDSAKQKAVDERPEDEPAHRLNRPRAPPLQELPSLHVPRTRQSSGVSVHDLQAASFETTQVQPDMLERLPDTPSQRANNEDQDTLKQKAVDEQPEDESAHHSNQSQISSPQELPSLHVPRTRRSSGISIHDIRAARFETAQQQFDERRRSISPRSEECAAAGRTLEKAIPRILSRDMDLLGYRKMQRLIQDYDRLFDEEQQYEELLNALLAELERAPEAKQLGSRRLMDFKTQVLITVQYTFRHMKRLVDRSSASTMELARFYPRILTALVRTRMHYEGSCHLALELTETAEEIITSIEQVEAVDTLVLMMMNEELNSRALFMGFSLLTMILRRMNTSGLRLPPRLIEKVGGPASKYMTVRFADVRQQATQLCVQLHKMTRNEEHFWKVLGHPNENSRRVLTYYIAKA
ncbi:hypothetical protein ASPCADRAFT_202657 [Aspergillus carbonarius ITEM 5010]|uniref:TOG domain-containing protein n=1 Tax=Aspergillus carbonarius (strain ITEM 5010) TaxID=602072 RepID=A0A1R3S237_ASPC5|nr:hypothetical protein ASPCADRAFT_202657 [Aspergillus carbonarius ITEM 5010]